MEYWKPIPGLDGYEASDHGRVRSVRKTYRILTTKNGGPYPRVLISHAKIGVRRKFTVHALVARAFIGPCPEGYWHNHKDGDKNNNRPDNLEFVTPSQNQRHSRDVLGHTGPHGSVHGMSKLNETKVVEIRRLYAEGRTQRELSEQFGVNVPSICLIVNGKTWKHILPKTN